MKIGYTYHGYNNVVSGIGRYIYNLFFYLKKENEISLLTRYAKNIYFEKEFLNKKVFFPRLNFKGKRTIEIFFQDIYLKKILKAKNYDVIHHSGEKLNVYKWLNKQTPVVITIHDMIPELYYNRKKDNKRKNERAESIKLANKIICISENTKRDLLIAYPQTPLDKISVIYHGAEAAPKKYNMNNYGNYFLFVGGRNRYKNFGFFLNAIASILLSKNIKLLCTGTDFTTKEKELITMLGISEVVINVGFVSNNELYSLYHHAISFAFPSLYEGFGFPILEAFTNECPVCLSNNSCFPEIAKDAALYFNPEDANSIKETFLRVLDNDLRDQLIKKGIERVKYFSWEKAAKETFKVYQEAINK